MAKLLIVDDEDDIREFASRFFKKRGIEVFVADNGSDGLNMIMEKDPDLVLLDITMDQMSGLEVLKKLREYGNDVGVIMVTGLADEETVNEANSWGIRGYIHKPLVLDELEKIVMGEFQSMGIL